MTKKETQKNTADIKALLASHQEHLLIANQEMGVVKNDIAVIKENISWIKESIEDTKKALDKFDSRTWAILATIVIGFLANLYFK